VGGFDAVEQAHGAFDRQQLCAGGRVVHQRIEQRGRHRPAVEIDARPLGRRFVKGRIDIVRPDFGGLDRDSAPLQRGEQGDCDGGLAGARARRGDD